jgi:hypothetical protein
MTWICAGTNCDQPLRRANVRAADAPGTLQVTADGLCKRCYNQRIFKETVHLTPEQLAQVKSALDGWMTARRKRLRSNEAPCANTANNSKKLRTNSNNNKATASSTSANYATC